MSNLNHFSQKIVQGSLKSHVLKRHELRSIIISKVSLIQEKAWRNEYEDENIPM